MKIKWRNLYKLSSLFVGGEDCPIQEVRHGRNQIGAKIIRTKEIKSRNLLQRAAQR
jgi:hypothetical protein